MVKKLFISLILISTLCLGIDSLISKLPPLVKTTNISKGKVAILEGRARKKNNITNTWTDSVFQNSEVMSNETYETMIKSRAELRLQDLDIIRLAPKSKVNLVQLYQEATDGTKSTKIEVEEGDIWADINSVDPGDDFKMETDIAAAAITGTNFRITKTGENTQLKVYHGEVKIANSKKNNSKIKPQRITNSIKKEISGPKQIAGPREVTLEKWIYIVKNMEQITFNKSGQIISMGSFSEKSPLQQSEWVRWNMKRNKEIQIKNK